MAKKKTAALALLIGLPLALHGQPIQMDNVTLVGNSNLSTSQQIETVLPLANLVSASVLEHKDYKLIRPVHGMPNKHKTPVVSSDTLMELAQLTRSTRF